ncbi:MAG: phosphoribosyltransferase [Deltaproteobacteria bacterium]
MAIRIISYDRAVFADRREAGCLLAEQLGEFSHKNAVVLGIPRGGIIIAREVASEIGASLDILLARKLQAPETPELAIGAIAENGTVYLNDTMIDELNIPKAYIDEEIMHQKAELRARQKVFRPVRPKENLSGRPVIVTDDGAATGATLEAALRSCRKERPSQLVCAFPSGSDEAVARLAHECDLLVALSVPPFFSSVSLAYRMFDQVTDEQVLSILRKEAEHENSKTGSVTRRS